MTRRRLIVPGACAIAVMAAGCYRPLAAIPREEWIRWCGTIGPGTPTRLIVDIHRVAGTTTTAFSLPDLGQAGFEFNSVTWSEDTLRLSAPTPQAPFVFKGTTARQHNRWNVRFRQTHRPFSAHSFSDTSSLL